MDRRLNENDHEGVTVVGFEVPGSPESSYNNPMPGNEGEAREPPLVPPPFASDITEQPTPPRRSNLPLRA